MDSSIISNLNVDMNLSNSLIAGSAVLAAYGAWRTYRFLAGVWYSPLDDLPGPPNPSYIFGNMDAIRAADAGVMHEKWVAEYGPVISYKGFFSTRRLYAMDMKALGHVFTHSYDWIKPEISRANLTVILGEGILIMEGDEHKKQRRILNPVFSPSHIKDLTPLFIAKAEQLKDIWLKSFTENKADVQKIDVLLWLSRATLDVIGQAGFGYRFDALDVQKDPDQLQKAFNEVFKADDRSISILQALGFIFPILMQLPSERKRRIDEAMNIMNGLGDQLIKRVKGQILGQNKDEFSKNEKAAVSLDTERIAGTDGRDLLTTLVRSNMDTDLPSTQRMSDVAIRGQVPTFLVAGHETSSTQTMWTLFALAKPSGQYAQKKLREELLSVSTSTPTLDQLNELPYLDAVLRESLRVHPAVTATMRVADKDDVVPLSKPFVDKKGRTQTSVRVQKGDTIFIPIVAVQRNKEIWGEDSFEFKPERWFNLPPAVNTIPGVTNGLLAFLNGSRSCIGYRFALAEIKALLFTLIREFEFELSFSVDDLKAQSAIVQRPYLKSDLQKGAQMPLLVKRYKGSN